MYGFLKNGNRSTILLPTFVLAIHLQATAKQSRLCLMQHKPGTRENGDQWK